MKKLCWLLAIAVTSILFFQCRKEVSFIGNPDTGVSVAPDPINTSVQGIITDENDQPAAGVVVTAGTNTAITDATGYFRFTNAALDKNTTLVTAAKDGYFKSYRVFGATSGCNQVAIKLIKKTLAGTVPASSGGEASLSGGAKVSLPANGVVMASSSGDYSGDVKIYASYINPKASDIGKTIPGSLAANDKNGKRVVLSSYGMLAVELSSATGEKLQIKSGSVATLTMPIPSSLVASAPAIIPLWYIDEPTGLWQEEGTATKQGNNYVGTVKHFSYWNCDYQNEAVNVSFTLRTPDGLPLVNAYVEIKPTGTDSVVGGLAHGYTDSLGQVKGLVPANKNLKFLVYNNCYEAVYSQDISPISQSTDLGTIKIPNATDYIVTLKGILFNCDNQPVTNGYALINLDGITRYASTDANGQFVTTYVSCSAISTTASLTGVDKDSFRQSNAIVVTVSAPVTDAGIITACGISSVQYINYTLDNVSYRITSSSTDSTTLYGYAVSDSISTFMQGYDSTNYIDFDVVARSEGTFPVNTFAVQGYTRGVTVDSPLSITFTKYPAVEEFYEGSFSGQFKDSTSVQHSLAGTFKVRRIN